MLMTMDKPTVARDDKLVDIEREIAEMATEVAKHRGITRAQYLSDLLRDMVKDDHLATLKAKLAAAQGKAPAAPKKPKGGKA